MKTQDYQAILHAIEQAIEVCDQSSGFMDQAHHDMCRDLRTIRDRLRSLIGAPKSPAS